MHIGGRAYKSYTWDVQYTCRVHVAYIYIE